MLIFDLTLLTQEKQLHPDWVFFIGDSQKNPQTFVGKWKEKTSQTKEEFEQLIEYTKNRTDSKAWNWGIRTGINNIACIDFDWEFIYYRWVRKFGDRAKTVTYRTANKCYRVLFKTKETTNDSPYKNSLHTEFENAGYAVLGGYAEDERGNKQPYEKINQVILYPNQLFTIPDTISIDNTLIADTKKWLAKQLERYDFLHYNCIYQKPLVDRKQITLTHDQRLAILHFMILKDFKDAEIHDFYKTVHDQKGRDYDRNITQTQIESGREYIKKGGKPHPCKPKKSEDGHISVPLYQIFNTTTEKCRGCLRKRFTKDATQEIDMGYALQYLNSKFTLKCPTDTKELLASKDGYYSPCEWKIQQELEKLFGQELKSHFVDETLKHLQRSNFVERKEINSSKVKIPVKNGILNLSTLSKEPFDSNQIFTYKLNVEYNPEKKCPKFEKFIKDILPNKNDQKLLQEIMGYCLLPDMPLHKLFWLHGVGRNGKDRIIITLEHIFGENGISHLSLSELNEKRRFSQCQLYGKFINVSNEPAISKYGIQTNLLKKMSGEGTIDAELKGKNKRLKFKNFAKPLIIGNNYPKVADASVGFWDRVEILGFPKSFTDDKLVPHIERRWLTNENEVSGILNWMLDGLLRLREKKQFTKSKEAEQKKLEFKRLSDPFQAWLMECCVFVPVGSVTREDAHTSYKNYCFELGSPPISIREFYSKLRNTPRVKEYRKSKERGFTGFTLRLADDYSENEDLLSFNDKSMTDMSSMTGVHTQEIVQDNSSKNKEVQEPDTPDTSVTKNDVEGYFPVCFVCHKPISRVKNLDNIDGKPCHILCRQKVEHGRIVDRS